MIIEVTAEDIKNGVDCDSQKCPIALALLRATERKWIVGMSNLFIISHDQNNVDVVYNTPIQVAEFIKNFDRGDLVEPFSFELSV